MTKEEMLSLGVPADKVKNLQNMYFRDVNKAAQRMTRKQDNPEPNELKKAIVSMLSIINDVDSLKNILGKVSYHCMKEYQPTKYERPSGECKPPEMVDDPEEGR